MEAYGTLDTVSVGGKSQASMIPIGCRREAYLARYAVNHVQPKAAFMRLAPVRRP